jgi:hypothetical protein
MIPRALGPAGGLGLFLLLVLVQAVSAHESNWSYLRLRVEGDRLVGEWELHRRDARILLGLDGDVAGEAGWRDLYAREDELRALLGRSLALEIPSGPCPVRILEGIRDNPDERDYAVARLEAQCPAEVERLTLGYSLLFDLDASHRGYFNVDDAHLTHVGTFTSDQREVTIDVKRLDLVRQSLDYLREGVWHIWTGPDHVLFLIALLLPAPLIRRSGAWQPRDGFIATLREVIKIVTAFTLAHSLTLCAAALGVVVLPVRWVESAIALSVFVAAWNNLRPFVRGRPWILALGFGLIHGLGFASALASFGMPRRAVGMALVAFNVGVELGQLALVAVILPGLYALGARAWYPRLVMGVGSLLIAWLAIVWMLERALGVSLVDWPG